VQADGLRHYRTFSASAFSGRGRRNRHGGAYCALRDSASSHLAQRHNSFGVGGWLVRTAAVLWRRRAVNAFWLCAASQLYPSCIP